MENRLSNRIAAVETRMNAMEARIDDIDKRLVIVENQPEGQQSVYRPRPQSKQIRDARKAVNLSRHLHPLSNRGNL